MEFVRDVIKQPVITEKSYVALEEGQIHIRS